MDQDARVRVGVHRLLADESDDVFTELLVLDEGKSFLEGLDKPFLTGREEQMEHVENVCAERIARNPVHGQIGPVELDIASLQQDVIRLGERRSGCRYLLRHLATPSCLPIGGERQPCDTVHSLASFNCNTK